jgi:hypothetical protein
VVHRPLTDLLHQPPIDDDCEPGTGMRFGRGTRSIRTKPAPMLLCPPQIPHDLGLKPGRGGKPRIPRILSRVMWSRDLRHELFRSLERWVRIPLKVWMSVLCVYSVSVALCAGSGLATG